MRKRRYLTVVALTVGLVGALLMTTSGAFGIHDAASSTDDVLRLHLNGAGDSYFKHALGQQDLTDPGNCEASFTPSLVSLTGFQGPSGRPIGLTQNSLGVKSKGPGISCGRVDDRESMVLSLVNGPSDALAGLNFIGGELDIETKKNVTVVAELKLGGSTVETFYLRTGTSIVPGEGVPTVGPYARVAVSTFDHPSTPLVDERIANCGSQSDSGPDSGANDNCRWIIDSLLPFDTIVFSPLDNKTEFGLEGGADGTDQGTEGSSMGTFDSLLFLTRAEGILACNDVISDSDGDFVTGTFTRLSNSDVGEDCVFLKPYLLEAVRGSTATPSGEVSLDLEGDIDAAYRGEVTLEPQPSTNPPTHYTLLYDRDIDGPDSETAVPWCNLRTSVLEPSPPPHDDPSDFPELFPDVYPTLDGLPDHPDGDPHTWCIVAVHSLPVWGGSEPLAASELSVTSRTSDTWILYGNDDPLFSGG